MEKSNNFDVKSNEELFKQALVEGVNRRFDRDIEEAKKIEQIEEMARDICHLIVPCEECTMLAKQMGQSKDRYCKAMQYAKRAYDKGYRKQSENVIELPCKVGDKIFFIHHINDTIPDFISDDTVTKIGVTTRGILHEVGVDIADFGNKVFVSKDEAEKALAKMKGGK